MSKLVEEVAEKLYHDWHEMACDFSKEKEATRMTFECIAQDYIKLISQHPETLERRRRDFEAGKSLARKRDMQRALSQHGMDGGSYISDQFDDYLLAEKGEKKT